MAPFTVDVCFATHDQLHVGTVGGWHRVTVLAQDGDAAILAATQMVAATQDAMPVDALIRI